ncbi:TfoX/Sxy family protein [Slackia heliotrinireducens]|uniref:TfoX/Sxy family protein n=1 Tax=Slackia heliotrinireducens TaxID=84110 RepID=UPI0033163439
MASSKEYLEFVLDLLRDVPAITHKKMMGEYLLYSEGVLFGGIYDDRLLLKDVPAARSAFSQEEVPYEGAKPMVLVDSEDAGRIAEVIAAMLPQLPAPKKKR